MKWETVSSENLLGQISEENNGRNTARDRLIHNLLSWHKHWALNGVVVQCQNCNAIQEADGDDLAFKHVADCSVSQNTQHPWRELAMLLRDLPSVSGYAE